MELLKYFRDDHKELWVEHTQGFFVERKECKDYLTKHFEELNWAVRYAKNGKLGLSYGTNFEGVLGGVEVAEEMTEFGISGELPELNKSYREIPIVTEEKLTPEEVKSLLEELEKTATSRGIKRIDKIKLQLEVQRCELIRGDIRLVWEEPFYTFLISLVAESESRQATSYGWWSGRYFNRERIFEEVERACYKAKALARGEKGASKRLKVWFPPEVAVDLIDLLEFSFSGEEVVKGRSKLKDKQGKLVFSQGLFLIDDGLNPELPESRPFDDEGMPQQKTVLVENGVVAGFLWDSFWGKKAGVKSTGNARRPNFKSLPRVSSTNIYILPGRIPLNEFLSSEKEVLEVIEVLGFHTADPISGDFSVGISGVIHRNGEPAEYISEMAMSENIFELFNKLCFLGNDLKFFGSTGSPSLIFEDIVIG